MATWPELDELKQVLDVESSDWDGDYDGTRLTRLLATAIDHVKQETGQDTETPSDGLAQAALRLAELMALKPEVIAAVSRGSAIVDPTYEACLYGQRRVFGIG